MPHTNLYTGSCTILQTPSRPPTLRSISDWQAAYASGALLADLLNPLRVRMQQAGLPVYLHVASEGELLAQTQTLLQRAAKLGGAAAVQAALPLFGVPFVVKDNIDISGVPTTAACPAFAHTAVANATVVQKLIDAGAVWLAKTNLDQFATGLVGTRSPYGAPASALAPGHISGGSSSGSAVAVAQGDVPFALGTDTAGSGRIPAAFNGIVGLKPTPGRVSNHGVLPACKTLDCVAVLAHHVADAAAVLAVIEGPDNADAYSHFIPGPATFPKRLRLGVPAAMPPLSAAFETAFAAACSRAQAAGHTLVPVDFTPLFDVAQLLYNGPWVAERHAVVRTLLAQHPDSLDPVVRNVIEQATRHSATDAFEGQYRLRELSHTAQALWQSVDALIVPSAPMHPRFEDVADDPVGVNSQLGQFTNFVNLLGWCALAVPAGTTGEGLPFGVTLIAPANNDAALAQAGAAWLGETTPSQALPRPATQATLTLAVVGAHLSGLPLNGQLTERGAHLLEATTTAADYRLFALPGTTPPKPGLQRVAEGGANITVELWAMPMHQVGSFLALIPAPLGLGTLRLADGRQVHGFLCEAHALADAVDITTHGGWRNYLASIKPASGSLLSVVFQP